MKTTRITAVLTLLLAGCQPAPEDDNQGIAVGNPGVIAMSIAASDDVEVEAAGLRPTLVRYGTCGVGNDATVGGGDPVDLADGPADYAFPEGTWCGVGLETVSLEIDGRWDPGTGEQATFTLTLDLPSVVLGFVDEVLAVDDETELAFELASPGWLDAAGLGLSDGDDLVVAAGDELHDTLVASLQDESAAFDDLDGSGVVEQEERDAGPLAVPADIQFNDTYPAGMDSEASGYATGCSCGATGRSDGAPLLLLLALATWRRGRRPLPRPSARPSRR